MVGVISSNYISQDKSSAPPQTTKSKSISDGASKSKLDLQKEPIKQSIQSQKIPEPRSP